MNITKKVILIEDRLDVMDDLEIINSDYTISKITKKLSDQLTNEYLNKVLGGDPIRMLKLFTTDHPVRYSDKYNVNIKFRATKLDWRDSEEDVPIITFKLNKVDLYEGPAYT